ncbi:hypothetical protein KP509_04G091500 [Ceratopteris richardii]|nr:hypothetical protein KP509_04G091500 [Ceratopteris richardii]
MMTINCTVKIEFNNTSKYLKVHLDPFQIQVLYSDLPVATNERGGYRQRRKSRNIIPVQMQASMVPLYGAAFEVDINEETIMGGLDVPLQISTSFCSRYYIASTMITSTFCANMICNITANTKTLALLHPINPASCF